jgi:hypothetical protein
MAIVEAIRQLHEEKRIGPLTIDPGTQRHRFSAVGDPTLSFELETAAAEANVVSIRILRMMDGKTADEPIRLRCAARAEMLAEVVNEYIIHTRLQKQIGPPVAVAAAPPAAAAAAPVPPRIIHRQLPLA